MTTNLSPKKFYVLAMAAYFVLLAPIFAEKIVFSANHLSGTIGDKSDSTTLSGSAFVKTESMEIYADTIKMSGDDFRFIEAEGNIKGKNTESELDFTCGALKYDRETKVATLSDKVNLIDTKNEVNAQAALIEYNQNTDIAIMQVDIKLTQKDNVCSGVYAVYRKKDQLLDLSGNAQIKQGDDTFRAQEITLDLDSQEITLDGRVKGSVVDERKSEDETKQEGSTSGDKADASTEPSPPAQQEEGDKTTKDSTAAPSTDSTVPQNTPPANNPDATVPQNTPLSQSTDATVPQKEGNTGEGKSNGEAAGKN